MEVVISEKDLGIVIANDTSRKDHIVMIVAKANRMLGFLQRNCAGIVGSTALLRLYCSLVRSHLSFCSLPVSYGPPSQLSAIYYL